MESSNPETCCVNSVRDPVQVLTLAAAPSSSSQQASSDLQLFRDGPSLDEYLNSAKGLDYTCRFISICQRNSWQPLQVTRSMLALIIDKHGFTPNLRNLTSCYYTKNNDLEESYCTPCTVSTDGPWLEVLYSIRYPEFKESEKKWAIRQTGICHRINTETRQNILLLLTPTPKSSSHDALYEHLTNPSNQYTNNTWFSLHDVLLKTHLSAWRSFNKACEAEFLPISNNTFAAYIDEPLRVGYDQLSALSSLEARFLKVTSLVGSTATLLDDLQELLRAAPDVVSDHRRQSALAGSLQNHRRHCAAYLRSAAYLRDRVQAAAQLLANTQSFRDQVIANEQNGNMMQLNRSAVFITTLTLIYAPASFVGTFFGMNFFAMDQPSSRIICTAMIWIYVLTTLALTMVTVIFYYWLLRHDGVLFGRLAPKIPVNADWKGFVRRFTKLDNSVEMTSHRP
ncbi:Mg2+ transporter protein, CorA-like/Zinc transport protein ZntB [Cordyceps fumosorosea ARSEF 2679]|uniref:Mg2+ transporter protein, CorA-like/Zinc transport protein ZntB n=1 Tax=Cordyceps fumosorosea (strain ARSEF 2679) TaxID=1081104 RepID=A0A167XEY8_CORFA|nr:Mg2+ transporter protein, CorA-like/Zinc transport protein ZntB [Cordyceps fumosorosea ARSEF 2679]OAA64897.1 Mg2+ transporter protein, CorA-like/Zinc transport protein ZntB [Cordyceps fumosorosea ARSEF 2679]